MPDFLNSTNALPPATITEDNGVRFLHLGTSWIQGAMRLAKPDAIELEYVQQMMAWMLFNERPQRIAQLGLGSGALTKFCHRHFPDAHVTAVELNPAVIATCRSDFFLPPNDDRLQVLQMDAMDFVMDPDNRNTLDVLQVDLYDEFAQGPVFDTPEFYQACADCLKPDGIMTTNLFGDHQSYEKNLYAILMTFDAAAWLPRVDDENMIVLGFSQSPSIDFATLAQRAAAIRQQHGLPAKSWVNGLKEWMRNTHT